MFELGYPEHRPGRRLGCLSMPRPCPFVSCKYHLLFDVSKKSKRIVVPGDKHLHPETDDFIQRAVARIMTMPETCTLDVTDEGPQQLPTIARITGTSKQAIEQMEKRALLALKNKKKK